MSGGSVLSMVTAGRSALQRAPYQLACLKFREVVRLLQLVGLNSGFRDFARVISEESRETVKMLHNSSRHSF